jgi:hypothetical protein
VKKKIRKTAMREFSRNLYREIKDLPVAVYNRRTKKCIVVIISPKEGGANYEL